VARSFQQAGDASRFCFLRRFLNLTQSRKGPQRNSLRVYASERLSVRVSLVDVGCGYAALGLFVADIDAGCASPALRFLPIRTVAPKTFLKSRGVATRCWSPGILR
jgi:hypothetical protein